MVCTAMYNVKTLYTVKTQAQTQAQAQARRQHRHRRPARLLVRHYSALILPQPSCEGSSIYVYMMLVYTYIIDIHR